jgi:hypothetical protein
MARRSAQQQVARGVPPRDAKHRGVKQPSRGEPLRRGDASLAVTCQDAIGYRFQPGRPLRGPGYRRHEVLARTIPAIRLYSGAITSPQRAPQADVVRLTAFDGCVACACGIAHASTHFA